MQMILGSSKPAVVAVLSLSGTALSPRAASQLSIDPTNAHSAWLIGCIASGNSIVKGQIQKDGYTSSPSYASVDTGTDWVIPNDFNATYYVRATLESDSAPSSGSGLGTWLSLVPGGANRFWVWSRSSVGRIFGTLKLEIATDSGGLDIVATGYYSGDSIVDPLGGP